MANTTIEALSSLTSGTLESGDLLIVRDVSTGVDKNITAANLKTAVFGANLADPAYTTGTFTPIVSDNATTGNNASGTFTGHYTKVGRLVTYVISLININTTGMTTSADVYIRGLPFNSTSLSGTMKFVGSVSTSSVNYASTSYVTAEIADNTGYIRLCENIDNTSNDYVKVSKLSSGVSDVYITITYFTAS